MSSLCRLSPTLDTYHHEVASILLGVVMRESSSVFVLSGPTGEHHPCTKSSEIGLGQPTVSTALLNGIRHVFLH